MLAKTAEIFPDTEHDFEHARITIFTPIQIVQIWDQIDHMLQSSAEVSPDLTLEDIHKNLLSGVYRAIVVTRNNTHNKTEICGILVFRTLEQKNNKVWFMVATAGKNITRINYFDALKSLMRENKIDKLQCWARPSAARLWNRLGIKTLYSVMEIDV